MTETVFVVHWGEIGLKGHNRPDFEHALVNNIKQAIGNVKTRIAAGRLVIDSDDDKIAEQLSRTFGIEYFAKAIVTDTDIDSISEVAASLWKAKSDKTIKIIANRSDKSYPMTSQEINVKVGENMVNAGAKVSMKPVLPIYVELADRAYIYSAKQRGPGGLPIGTAGKVLCLLSGGIDSPVAAWLMAKRGCTVDFLHFHPFRSGKEVEKSKMVDIVKKLKQWGISGRLWVAPFYPFQAVVPEGRTEVVLFRRHMLRVAEALARREGHAALVTGDNLGQVASQTLTNLAATSNNIGLPVLRPVITYDKSEIVTLAQRIGTYEPSIIEYRDCCSLVARNPVTHARDRDIKEAEEKFDTAALVNETLSATETVVCD